MSEDAKEPKEPKPPKVCGAMMDSRAVPGHTHVCSGTHDAGDHKCVDPSCGRYFFSKVSA